jgi:multiple sugar transport system permease protein
LPLLALILVTLAIFAFLTRCKDVIRPLVGLAELDHYTLPVGLATLSREHVQDNEGMLAGSALTVFSVLLLFRSRQRYNIESILVRGIKG